MADLQDKALSGMSWLTFAQLTKHLLQFQLGIILARLLTPRDFGLIGLVMVFVGFAGLFSEMGLGAALIQREHVDARHWSSAFWLNVAAGILLTGAFILCAPFISRFYDESILTPVTMVIAITFTVGSLSMVPIAMLTRDVNFRTLALVETISAVVGGVVAVVLAILGFGVWSLVWRTLAVAVLTAAGLYWVTRWRPSFRVDGAAVRELLGFSTNLLGYRAITYWSQNGNDLIIGRFLGTATLGIYSRAYIMLLLPLNEVVRVVGRVMFPVMSRMQHDVARVKSAYLRALAVLALGLFPVMLGLSSVSNDFVLALYGSHWSDVIPILAVLSIAAVPQSVSATTGWVFQSQGRTDWILRWGILVAVATLGSVGLGIWIGSLLAVVVCYTVTSFILVLPSVAISGRLIGMGAKDVLQAVAGPLACSVAMALTVVALSSAYPSDWPAWLSLLASIIAGGAVYIALVHGFDLRAYADARSAVRMLKRNRAGMPTTGPVVSASAASAQLVQEGGGMTSLESPFVSVIIPVYNDPIRLTRCLEALEQQSWPTNRYEVIVIDNGSDEPLSDLTAQFDHVKLLLEPQPGSYVARNRGLGEAVGEVIAFTDADCLPAQDWLESGVKALCADPKTGLVGGRVEMLVQDPVRPTAVELYERVLAFQQETNINKNRYSVTANAFTLRSVFDRVGQFNAVLKSGGDVEWGRRVDAAGYQLVYSDDTVVAHPARRSWHEVHAQARRMAGGLHDRRRDKPRSVYRWLENETLLLLTIPTMGFRILRNRSLDRIDERMKAAVVMAAVHLVLFWEQLRLQLGSSTPQR